MATKRERSLTGVKPTGTPHIGNYLGAIRPAIELSKKNESFLFIADFHALTTEQDPARMKAQTYEVAATWLALGLDPNETVFYTQSDVPETATLAWILSCFTPLGLLNRAHSVKDARAKGVSDDDLSHGLLDYPVLMAADILLYDADVVPVGKDQKQHLEITQEIARKFNNTYGDVLRVPRAQIDERVMTIPGLDGRKMSKSYGNVIGLFDPDKRVIKRIKEIKTDSTPYGEPLRTEDETVFALYQLLASPEDTAAMRRRYETGRRDPERPDAQLADAKDNYFGWGNAKKALYECVLDHLGPARAEYARLMADQNHIRQLLLEGADKARAVARPVLQRVQDAVGFVGG